MRPARFHFVFPLIASAAATALLASCVSPPPEAQKPAEPVKVAPVKPESPEPGGPWTDWPITPGSWVYRQDARGSIALFGSPGSDALVTLRCDRQRRKIYLARASAQNSAEMTLRSSSRLQQFNARAAGGTPPYLAVEITPQDPILDALAYSRGRIAIQTGGEISLALPVWSEIGRIVEDCRS